jgi:hypothetical protein
VDYDHFSSALHLDTPAAPQIAALPHPVLGFFGLIHEWLDQNLLGYLAARHPDWTIALIGKTSVDISALTRYRNVHFLGHQPYSELPKFCKHFEVGLIPFKVNELTQNVNPIKLREYLSAGLRVVSTALPEVEQFQPDCTVARTYQEFEAGIVKALDEDTPAARRQRSHTMRAETWEQKIAAVGAIVARVQRDKRCD